ncbi:hypothetical protein GGS20DRAFT_310043 [Poronia punctata]|nr:hypothetical protein GGS20DRAFT_310043 [Poronia punctata]
MEDSYSDFGFDANLDIRFDLSAELDGPLMTEDADFPLESSEDGPGSDDVADSSETQGQQRPYLSKRPHRKSRAGCKQCKRRKVKCDEAKPTCRACTLRKETCVYPKAQPPPSGSNRSPAPVRTVITDPLVVPRREQSAEYVGLRDAVLPIISEPLFMPDQMADATDMKMLWFYTAYSFQSFSINSGRSTVVDYALKVKIVEHAFRSPFLMETLKGLSALHLRLLNQPVLPHKLASYQAGAFEGYRSAIEAANPNDFPALLACSLFMVAMSSQAFRDPNGKRLFIVDWTALWRGIGLIVQLVSPRAVQESGLSSLFYRPPIDLDKAAQYIPNNLLFMVSSIKHGDDDYDYQNSYYELLRYLGSLYTELKEHGFGPVLQLRIITFLSFCPRPLLPLAKQHRPRMLIILAHWLSFVKLLEGDGAWWMQGLAPHIAEITDELGPEWSHLLRIPQRVMETPADDKNEIAKLIIDNHDWTPKDVGEDTEARTNLSFINNDGSELEIADGHWRLKTTGVKWEVPQMPDPKDSRQKLLLGTSSLYNATPHTTPGLSSSQSSVERSPSS